VQRESRFQELKRLSRRMLFGVSRVICPLTFSGSYKNVIPVRLLTALMTVWISVFSKLKTTDGVASCAAGRTALGARRRRGE
jgi:hypothetical protein